MKTDATNCRILIREFITELHKPRIYLGDVLYLARKQKMNRLLSGNVLERREFMRLTHMEDCIRALWGNCGYQKDLEEIMIFSAWFIEGENKDTLGDANAERLFQCLFSIFLQNSYGESGQDKPLAE